MNKYLWRLLSLAILLVMLPACEPQHLVPAKRQSSGKNNNDKSTEAMGPYTHLRKISLHLRGKTPTLEEYTALGEAALKGETARFLRDKTQQYLSSDEHIDKMSFRFEELLYLAPSALPFYSVHLGEDAQEFGTPVQDPYSNFNALNSLVREIISRNLSWDTLLTSKKYTLNKTSQSRVNDETFYAALSPQMTARNGRREAHFEENDDRIAGVITTSRFFTRYATTALNKNRRRSAAILRIFMCDDMKAVIAGGTGNDNKIIDRIFPPQPTKLSSMAIRSDAMTEDPDPHNANPDCMKCHFKLDPLARTLRGSGHVLSPLTSPGGLVFKRKEILVDLPARSIGHVAELITQQPEYLRCQVKHFWRWFIGEDKPLEASTVDELVSQFNAVNRRPNDFIAYLLSRAEFSGATNENEHGPLIHEVKKVLRNCNGCHEEELIPAFTDWPIGDSEREHKRWLKKISRSLNLDGKGERTMPPRRSDWQPTESDLNILRQWYKVGAPNEKGERKL